MFLKLTKGVEEAHGDGGPAGLRSTAGPRWDGEGET